MKDAVLNCGREKARGPNGFTFKFIKYFWPIMQHDIMRCVRYFEEVGGIARGNNSSFITLLLKLMDPLSLVDYQLISLIGCIYKIIAKALTSMLERVIGLVIDEVQTVFIEGRDILNGPMIINELCTWANKTKSKNFLFKVDFDKAFNSISWKYMESIMIEMGFGCKWILWIKGCLPSSKASALINGSATKELSTTKGARKVTLSLRSCSSSS